MATQQEVLKQIADTLQVNPETITPTTQSTDLAIWDSMAVVDLVFMLQQHFDVSLPPEKASLLTSVPAVLDILREAGKLE